MKHIYHIIVRGGAINGDHECVFASQDFNATATINLAQLMATTFLHAGTIEVMRADNMLIAKFHCWAWNKP